MRRQTRDLILVGTIVGSLWACSEVVLGSVLRVAALPMRSMILTSLGVGCLFGALAYTRKPWVVGWAVLVAVTAKVVFAPSFGFGIKTINSSAAVLLEGSAIFFVSYLLAGRAVARRGEQAAAAGLAILCAGTAFYAIGMNLVPCAYLKSFTPAGFFLRETLAWSLLSAVTAPLGYAVGQRLAARNTLAARALPIPLAWASIGGCWVVCALVTWLGG